MQKGLLVFAFISLSFLVSAQTGSITGTLIDAKTKEAIPGGSVLIEGTSLGTSTDLEGKFILHNVPVGIHTLRITYVGYRHQKVSGIQVVANEAVSLTVELTEELTELGEVVISARADKTDEMVLLRDRKKSIDIVQHIGAQELSRKGISNAESAVAQITGVSKQEGVKNVFVRGLGDRYNSTSFNGLPLPSEDPQMKNIALTFFTTNIIHNIEVNKTFNSKIYGDAAGANVNIISRDLLEDQELTISGSLGANRQTVSSDFYRADGNNFFGSTKKDIPVNNLSRYTFKNSINPEKLNGSLLNHSFALTGGKTFYIGNNPLKIFAVASSSGDFFYTDGRVSQTNTVGDYRQDLTFKRSEYTVFQMGMTNVNYSFADNTKLTYNLLYVHNNKQVINNYRGFSINGVDQITEPNAYDNLIVRQQTNDNTLLVNQLTGNFTVSEKLALEVRGSFNTIFGNEPDRRTNFYIGDGSGESYFPNNSAPAFNHRFFSTLRENELSGNGALIYKVNEKSKNNRLIVGYNFRLTDRDFEFVQFNFNNMVGNVPMDPESPDAYFNQQNIDQGIIRMETSRGFGSNALIPFFYTGDRTIHAGVIQFEYDLTPSLSLTTGARLETLKQDVQWSVSSDVIRPEIPDDNLESRSDFYVLPNLNLKYALSDNHQLRLSASRTYTYPQFKEVAPFLYEDVNENVFGNPELRPAANLNIDLKFERYFSGNGLFAIAGFYKHITHAINMAQVNSAALEFSYLNTGNARVLGGEIEFKSTVLNFSSTSFLSVGINVSYLYATQQLKNDPTSSIQFTPTHNKSALEGAAPLLLGADLTFNKETDKGKITSALVFAYFSDRIYSLGVNGQDNIYERGIPKLDWISKVSLTNKLTLDVNVRNILNPEYRLTKQVLPDGKTDLIRSYTRGVSGSIGFSYRF
jgi:outer membrane receptor protein involved in Fe transport